jgi:pimeloyl-ACP methyl ester carboxylesterase
MSSPFPNPPWPQRGQSHCLHIESEQLKGNFWNDPSHRELWVHTPKGYDSRQSYPVVVFLAGFAGTGEAMLSRSLTDLSLSSRCDHWIADGCPPFISVFPDCMTTLGGSQFVDSPAIGRYASYLIKEVLPFVSNTFSTNGKFGLAGRSSGGYGALRLAMEYPESISAVACHAGDMGFETAFLGEITAALGPLHAAGSPRKFLEAFWRKKTFSANDFAAFNLLCMSAAYTPNVQAVDFPADLPIDIHSGRVDFDVFQRWMAHDPIELLCNADYQEALMSLDYLFIDVGRYDEYHLQFGSRIFRDLLQKYGIKHRYEEFDGGHRGTAYRYGNSIPNMVEAML